MDNKKVQLSQKQLDELLTILKGRFEKNMSRHTSVNWSMVEARLKGKDGKLWSLNEMERTGGEPDVIAPAPGENTGKAELFFYDCSDESPKGRRSLCYDREALDSRKENKPGGSALELAVSMGIDVLTEEQYRHLQQLGSFDTKTSSWVKTPADIRKLGGAIFCDRRYNQVFLYHNGAESYYAARGFRGSLRA